MTNNKNRKEPLPSTDASNHKHCVLRPNLILKKKEKKEGMLLGNVPYNDFQRHTTLNPFHPNISLHILHTVLYTFPKVLKRRFCLLIKSFF